MTSLLLTDVELDGSRTDVRVEGGLVVSVGAAEPHSARPHSARPHSAELHIAGGGGALLPGLAEHHAHLLALAADARSVRCGPPEVRDRDGLARALRGATPTGGWVRGTGYHESVAGSLDASALDALVADRPVRVQHRSGALWILNTPAVRATALADAEHPGVERGADGTPTGRLWRADAWLRSRLPPEPPDLAAVGRRLAAFGVTAVTDATPDLDDSTVMLLAAAATSGQLPQRLLLLGAADGTPATARVAVGPRKVLLHDHDLPTYDVLAAAVIASRAAGRAVAVHCVTRESLLLTLAVLEDVGAVAGDRIEHAAVVPPVARQSLRRLGVTVVTQPGFVLTRGDRYAQEVDPTDLPLLYPYRSLLAAGVRVAPSSDAPFGDPDPWTALRAARDRRTRDGRVLGGDEAVPVPTALAGLLSPLDDPGGPARRVEPGAPADLCLLHVPLAEAVRDPAAELVRAVVCGGGVVFRS